MSEEGRVLSVMILNVIAFPSALLIDTYVHSSILSITMGLLLDMVFMIDMAFLVALFYWEYVRKGEIKNE